MSSCSAHIQEQQEKEQLAPAIPSYGNPAPHGLQAWKLKWLSTSFR